MRTLKAATANVFKSILKIDSYRVWRNVKLYGLLVILFESRVFFRSVHLGVDAPADRIWFYGSILLKMVREKRSTKVY